jgi:hypothetical protein
MHILSLNKFHGYFIYITTNDIKIDMSTFLSSLCIHVSFDYCQNLMCILYNQGSCDLSTYLFFI